ncbi:hypothetical protein ACWC2H_05175 [Streptomyces sp. 900105755]
MIYQHSDADRQREVAAGLDGMVRAERAKHHTEMRPPPTGLDNKEPPGPRPGGFCWSG